MKHNISNLPSFKGLKQRVIWLANEIKQFYFWLMNPILASEISDKTKYYVPIWDNVNLETKYITAGELESLLTDGIGVKVYKALITQSGTDDPVATILENTLGAIPVWSRDGIGQYYLTLLDAFPLTKTLLPPVVAITSGQLLLPLQNDKDSISFESIDLDGITPSTPIDIDQPNIPILIEVYP